MVFSGRAKRLLAALGTAVVLIEPAFAEDPRLGQAAALVREGSPDRAAALLNEVVQEHPSDAEAYLMLGSALSRIPRRDEAVKALLRALELRPRHAAGYFEAGTAFARLGEQDAALRVFQRAVALDPALGEAHLNIALILAAREELDQAAKYMARALVLEKDSSKRARLHFLQGMLHSQRDRLDQAASDFETAIALDPRNGEAFLALGATRKRLLLDGESLPMFEKAVDLMPSDPTARYQLALELMRRGRSAAAVGHLRRALELRPNDQPITYSLTRALHKAGHREEAARYRAKLDRMATAADTARENAFASARLHGEAVRLEKAGDYAAALNKYRDVLEFEPLNVIARRNMALVLCRLKRWEEGIEELRAILRDSPDDAETARALTIALDQAAESAREQ